MVIGNREFILGDNTYIMGILNVTPDSFSDAGKNDTVEKCVRKAVKMIKEGADIIDIGGESTRPGAVRVSAEEELERVIPVIEAIRKKTDVPISLDTYKAEVAAAGLRAGADMINDVSGLKADENMAEIIAKYNAACVLTEPGSMYPSDISNIVASLKQSIAIAAAAGIPDNNIILDPGIGFGKSTEENLDIIRKAECFKKLDFPILLGHSRKSFIGNVLDRPVDKRLAGTLAVTAAMVMNGCDFIRVHDVKENADVIKMIWALQQED